MELFAGSIIFILKLKTIRYKRVCEVDKSICTSCNKYIETLNIMFVCFSLFRNETIDQFYCNDEVK